ncbi:uncharacterized protein [Miscanthus floridulus]|uniref:uncharacterized protein n=1 Tax=Miscanthus floridulus TaxID=154761 RepID=UPI003458978E
MAAYYREAHQLEDKFNGLELNHILRHLNEAADAMAKVTSDREPVLMGVFASDQHKPLVQYEGLEQAGDGPPIVGSGADQSSAPSGPKVMELEEDPAIEPNPLVDWRMPYHDYLLYDMLPMDKTVAPWHTSRQVLCSCEEQTLQAKSH